MLGSIASAPSWEPKLDQEQSSPRSRLLDPEVAHFRRAEQQGLERCNGPLKHGFFVDHNDPQRVADWDLALERKSFGTVKMET
jgi:hypothetical protein